MAIQTKQLIADAFLKLCEKKPISKITVKNIIDECSVGRQTFYNHFPCKDDLILWIFETKIRTEVLDIKNSPNEPLINAISSYYSVYLRYRKLITNVKWNTDNNVLYKLQYTLTSQYYYEHIRKYFSDTAITDDIKYAIEYTVHGQTGLFYKWVEDGMKIPPQEMAKYAVNNISPILKSFLSV